MFVLALVLLNVDSLVVFRVLAPLEGPRNCHFSGIKRRAVDNCNDTLNEPIPSAIAMKKASKAPPGALTPYNSAKALRRH